MGDAFHDECMKLIDENIRLEARVKELEEELGKRLEEWKKRKLSVVEERERIAFDHVYRVVSGRIGLLGLCAQSLEKWVRQAHESGARADYDGLMSVARTLRGIAWCGEQASKDWRTPGGVDVVAGDAEQGE